MSTAWDEELLDLGIRASGMRVDWSDSLGIELLPSESNLFSIEADIVPSFR
jgi:hypothetical protein